MDKDLVLTRAKNAEMTHDFVTAVRAYKELLNENPKNIDYLNSIASIYVKAGEDEKAIPFYEEIISYYPHYVQAMNSLGAIFRRLHRYEESIDILNKALSEGRDSAMVNYNLGFTYKEMKMYADAIDCFELTVSMNPDDVLAYNHLGSIYLSQKDYQKAIVSFKRGLQIDQNHPILNYNLACCYEQTDQITEAIRCYELALKTKPGWSDAIHSFSELLLKCKKTKEAQTIVQRSISLYPNDEKLLCMLGDIFLTQFDYDSAEKTFKRAENVNKNNIEALSGLAQALENNEKVDEALQVLEKALGIAPENKKLQKQEASVLLSANYLDEAYERIQNLYKSGGETDSEVLDLYGQYYVCTNDDESARYYFNKIKSQDRHYKDYLLSSSRRYSQIGNHEAAEKSAQEYITRKGNDPLGYNALGRVYAKSGNLDKAISTYNQGTSFPQSNIYASKQVEKLKKQLADESIKKESEIPEEQIPENQNQENQNLNPEEIIEKATENDFDFTSLGNKGSGFKQIPISPEESLWDDFSDEFEDTEEAKAEKEKQEALKPKPNYYEPKFASPESEPEFEPELESETQSLEVSEPADSDDDLDEVMGMEEIPEKETIEDLEPEGFEESEKADDFDFSQFEDTTETKEEEPEIPETFKNDDFISSGVENRMPVPKMPEVEMQSEPLPRPESVRMTPREQYQAPVMNQDYMRELELQRQSAATANSANYAMEIAMVTQQMAQKLADGQTKLALVQKELEEKVKQTEQMQEELVMHQLRAEQLELELQEKKQEYEEKVAAEKAEEVTEIEEASETEKVEEIEEIEEVEEKTEQLENPEEVESLEEQNNEENLTSEQMFFLVNDNISDSEDFTETEPAIPDSEELINQLIKEEKEIQMDFEFATVDSILADLMLLDEERSFPSVNKIGETESTDAENMEPEEDFASVEDFAAEETDEPQIEESEIEEDFVTVDDFESEEDFASVDEFVVEESQEPEEEFASVDDFAVEESETAESSDQKPLSTDQIRYLVDDEVIPEETDFAASEKGQNDENQDVIFETQEYLKESAALEEGFATVDNFGTEEPEVPEEDFASVDDFAAEETEEPEVSEEDFASVDEFVVEESQEPEEDFASVEDFAAEEADEPQIEKSEIEEDFVTVDDFGTEEPEVSEEEFASVDDFAVEETEDVETSNQKPLSTDQIRYLVDDEVIPEETDFAESEKGQNDENQDVIFETQEYLKETAALEKDDKSEMQALLQKIEEMLQDKSIASEYKAELEMFKKLKLLMEFLPAEAVSHFNMQKLRVQIEYIISRISGKPGLCVTITSLIKSGALGDEYASKFASTSSEEAPDCSVEVIMNVIQSMKKLAENLPDNQLAKALCESADEVIHKIVD